MDTLDFCLFVALPVEIIALIAWCFYAFWPYKERPYVRRSMVLQGTSVRS